MEEWKEYKLGEIADIQTGPFGTQLHQRNYVPAGTPCIMPTNIGSRLNIDTTNIAHVGNEDLERLNRHCVKEGDIIYSRRGDVEKCAYILPENEGWLCGTGCLRIRINSNSMIPRFIAYQLSTQECKKWIVGNAVGSTMLNLNSSILKELPIYAPDIKEQVRITSVLKSLDDKIEINRRINDNLEQQAQALFKSWFVDFEPFLDQPFVESKLGMIPEGWKVMALFEVAEIYDRLRKPLSGKDRANMECKYPYYGATSCMDYVDNYIFDGIYTLIGEDGSVVKEDGLPYMQYVWGKFWVNNHAHILQGKNGFSTEMIHVLLSITNIQHLVTGAVQAKLSQANMQKILLAIPPSDVLDEVRPIIGGLYEMRRKNEDESAQLAQLRDTLLPRLMSGEIKVGM